MTILLSLVLCVAPVVLDGDTFRCSNFEKRFRMAGIDAPDHTCKGRRFIINCHTEGARGGWTASRDKLKRLLKRGPVYVHIFAKDPYKRNIATVCVNETNVNKKMVDTGFALFKPTWNGRGLRVQCRRMS